MSSTTAPKNKKKKCFSRHLICVELSISAAFSSEHKRLFQEMNLNTLSATKGLTIQCACAAFSASDTRHLFPREVTRAISAPCHPDKSNHLRVRSNWRPEVKQRPGNPWTRRVEERDLLLFQVPRSCKQLTNQSPLTGLYSCKPRQTSHEKGPLVVGDQHSVQNFLELLDFCCLMVGIRSEAQLLLSVFNLLDSLIFI